MFVYPATDLEKVSAFKSLLGTFWTSVFTDQANLQAYYKTMTRLFEQVYQNYSEVMQCSVRLITPVFHKELCQLVKLYKSKKGLVEPRYDDEGIYYDNGLIYDDEFNVGDSSWQIDSDIVSLSVLVDSLDDCKVYLVEGVDFFLTNNVLQFIRNPFDSVSSIPDGDDEYIRLFALDVRTEKRFIRDHWGYVVALSINNSSQGYLDTVNAILDSVVASPSTTNVRKVLEAACGCDLVRNDNETVEGIYFNGITRTVVTDKEAYNYPAEAEVEVEVGDVVAAGDALTDRIKIYDIGQGDKVDDLEAIVIGEGMLVTGGQLTFHNREVPLELVGSYTNGHPKLRFEIGGIPTVVDAFWAEADRFAEESGVSVANYLTGIYEEDPQISDLPVYVNPLEFLCEHVLRWACSIARIRPISQSLSRGRLIANLGSSLRQTVPAEGVVIVIIDMVTLQGEAVNNTPTISSYLPAESITGSADNNDGRFTASIVRGVYLK